MNRIDNVARVFLKTERAGYLRQVDLHATAPVYEVDEEVLQEINRKKELVNSFTFKG
ncbi:MAG: hypothetical protein IJE43_25515 [Alphaproteobacteria bacterium]|nr:hypothetical protein [Alphaproteobacteria bacterium]